MFSLQKVFQLTGLFWGAILALVGCYLTTYGLAILSETAGLVEDDLKMKKRLKNLDELGDKLPHAYIPGAKWLMMIGSLGIMTISTITNLFMVCKLR